PRAGRRSSSARGRWARPLSRRASTRVVRELPIQHALECLEVQLGAVLAADAAAVSELLECRAHDRLGQNAEGFPGRERQDLYLTGALEEVQPLEGLGDRASRHQPAVIAPRPPR